MILGPTATGKTALALSLAKKFNGEIVSCDSRQVYVGLDIGTGKLPSGRWKMEDARLAKRGRWEKGKGWWEINGVKIWMYDVVSPSVQYTLADYVRGANRVIKGIREKGKLPIIVGGTGLYLKALLYGLSNLAVPVDAVLRNKLEKLTRDQLQKKLQLVSIKRWEKMNSSDRANPRRLVRAIELALSNHEADSASASLDQDILKIGLTAPREVLYSRADERVVKRLDQGMIEEVKRLHKNGLTLERMKQLGLEYGILADYLDKKIESMEELKNKLQWGIHGFIRRQLTWFKKEKNINWFNIDDKDFPDDVEKLVAKWYHPR